MQQLARSKSAQITKSAQCCLNRQITSDLALAQITKSKSALGVNVGVREDSKRRTQIVNISACRLRLQDRRLVDAGLEGQDGYGIS